MPIDKLFGWFATYVARNLAQPFGRPLHRLFGKLLGCDQIPIIIAERQGSNRNAAIVFVHGFSGSSQSTFKSFVALLADEDRIRNWDIFSVGYPSNLRVDVPGIWSSDPDICLCSHALITQFNFEPLSKYDAIVLVAHSMGGLVVQRALIDSPDLAAKCRHIILYGTPSAGLIKAQMVAALKPQLRDMGPNSAFIRDLRSAWDNRFDIDAPFRLTVVQGDMDQFVSETSSLRPFKNCTKEVVHGNHLEIVRPKSKADLSYRIVVENMVGGKRFPTIIDSALLAIEQGLFPQAVASLLPYANELDDQALVSLALALEETGRRAEALTLLKDHYKRGSHSTDVLGVLGGRLKREWLVKHRQSDWDESRKLYSDGLEKADTAGDHEQGFYHAINLAFLELMIAMIDAPVPATALQMARVAKEHCFRARQSAWQLCTLAEADLILGDLELATSQYEAALEMMSSPREINSVYSQAIQVASRVFGEIGAKRIEKTFGVV